MSGVRSLGSGILFRVAAGPRQGFGHLVRARVLARALGVRRPLLSVRGPASARNTAARLGFDVLTGSLRQSVLSHQPSLIVIDDPSSRQACDAARVARRAGVRIVSVHDLGRAYCQADLSVDGSLVSPRWPVGGRQLVGPRFSVLDPNLAIHRGLRRDPRRVLIALGGGPRTASAAGVAAAIVRARPDVEVRIAAGFVPPSARRTAGVRWLPAQPGLASELARCGAAVVGGGVSLYEAATLRTPVVAWPVVSAQRPTVDAFDRAGQAIAVLPGARRADRAARAVLQLLDGRPVNADPRFDGRGAHRVAREIRRLVASRTGGPRA